MKAAGIPLNESKRLQSLKDYNILDTKEEEVFNDITMLAAVICNTPIALISFVDTDRQWFKSHHGLDIKETPRDISFCAHLINESNIFIVEDALNDERFKDNPLTTGHPHIRFYAGVPLTSPEGFNIGSLCVIDRLPRSINKEQMTALEALAKQVIAQLELQKQQNILLTTKHEMEAIQKSYSIIEFNANGIIIGLNENFKNLFGYHADEIIGQHHSIFIPYHLRENPEYLSFWESLRNGNIKSGEFKRITKDEKEIWIRGSYNPVFNHSGKIIKIINTFLDITEEKIKATDAQQKIAAISTSNIVIEFDMSGRILFANDIYLELLGYKLDEIIGKPHSFLIPNYIQKSFGYRKFWDDLRKGIHQSGQYERVKKDGSSIYLRGTYNPIFDLNGTPCKVVKHALDITQMQILSTNSSEILQSIDRSTACIEFDLYGNIIAANERFLKLTKYSKSELIGLHHSIFLCKEDSNSEEYKEFWKELRNGTYKSGDFLRINKFGKNMWIRGSYNPIFDIHGKPYKILKYALDISEIKISEKKAKEAEERARFADRSKTDFLYSMSHEIRTPLNGILAMIGLMKETNLNAHQIECAEVIHQSGKTLLSLINDLLDFGKIEAGKMEVEKTEFNLCYYLKEILKPFEYIAQEKDIKLKLKLSDYTNYVK